jgi:hypothetical protein
MEMPESGPRRSVEGRQGEALQGMTRRVVTLLAATAISAVAGGCDTQGETIGAQGGLILSEDGRFSLEVPARALDHDVEIFVDAIDCERPDTMGACYDVQPRGTAFVLPAAVAFEIADMDLADVHPKQLGVIVQRGDSWRVLADRTVDTEDEVVYGSALYLSAFALVPVE